MAEDGRVDEGGDGDGGASRGAPRRIALAWAALVALLLASLGSAFVPLGPWNPASGSAIAVAKTAIVGWLYMRLRHAGALVRIVAGCGFAGLALLAGLSGVDYATRVEEPAAMQQPKQVPPVVTHRASH